MPHIKLPENMPGMIGVLKYSPETAKPLMELVEVLMRGPSSLSRSERALIAMYTSSLNDCRFCTFSHGAIAKQFLGGDSKLVASVLNDYKKAPISQKLKALFAITREVQKGGTKVRKK